MQSLVKKVRNIRKKPNDEDSSLTFINTPPYIEYNTNSLKVRAKGLGTGAIAFRKLVLEKGNLEDIYNGFQKRNLNQFTFPLGVCKGPSGNGPGIEFDFELTKLNDNYLYFRLKEPGVLYSHLVGYITHLSKNESSINCG